jgi:hypothetical protein
MPAELTSSAVALRQPAYRLLAPAVNASRNAIVEQRRYTFAHAYVAGNISDRIRQTD